MKVVIGEKTRAEIGRRAGQTPQLLTAKDMMATLSDVKPENQPEFEQVWWPEVLSRNISEVNAYLTNLRTEQRITPPEHKPTTTRHPLLIPKLSVPQAAKAIGISGTNLRVLTKAGSIPVVKIGGKYLFYEQDIVDFIAKRYGTLKIAPTKKKVRAFANFRNSPLLDKNVKI